jgi:hypothetical protein
MGIVGLSGRCQLEDLILISDTDELASREAVIGFDGDYASLGMERMRYFMNYRQALEPNALKLTTSLCRARYLRSIGLSYARCVLGADKRVSRILKGGWHFTSIGGAADIVHKLKNSAHQEHAGDAETDAVGAHLAQIRSGVREPGWERVELDDRFPAYLRANRQAFEDVLL